ncbi:protein of unknown function [Streptomyces sp. KY70]|nr:protein of unknown function [Streptomyces sp. KY70]
MGVRLVRTGVDDGLRDQADRQLLLDLPQEGLQVGLGAFALAARDVEDVLALGAGTEDPAALDPHPRHRVDQHRHHRSALARRVRDALPDGRDPTACAAGSRNPAGVLQNPRPSGPAAALTDALHPVDLAVLAVVEAVGDLLRLGLCGVSADPVAVAAVVLPYHQPREHGTAVAHRVAPPHVAPLSASVHDTGVHVSKDPQETAVRICPSVRLTFTQRRRLCTKRYTSGHDEGGASAGCAPFPPPSPLLAKERRGPTGRQLI